MSVHRFSSFDGARLAWHEMGPVEGRPLLLLHGLFSSAEVNWIKFGTADRLARAGFRVLMLDFRAHGQSEAPTDAKAYPVGVLERDTSAWLDYLAISDFDMAGFSLGARTAAITTAERMLEPGRLALCGMSLAGITDHGAGTRIPDFVQTIDSYGSHKPGTEAYMTQQFLKTNKVDLTAARALLHAVTDTSDTALRAIDVPTHVICGAEDIYLNGARELADAIPGASFAEIPGTHMSSVTKPEFGEALASAFG
ncbi:alpha/beta hydrolase [Pacificimonas flava]|uniref:Alpha/beta hydrolase n=2 Tax=Pacificimonas TaxID=1960290 RepID=A0A219B5A1_9SPHN|nr:MULTISPECIES: alpha/beta fold hydrolase [Pacificimonas]MBZ6379475.1 alpha/beta fold hydrolase [Pacificimonas aurantium]OWV33333.1 alpha/beta hydrolase [Pacificimonas flava]